MRVPSGRILLTMHHSLLIAGWSIRHARRGDKPRAATRDTPCVRQVGVAGRSGQQAQHQSRHARWRLDRGRNMPSRQPQLLAITAALKAGSIGRGPRPSLRGGRLLSAIGAICRVLPRPAASPRPMVTTARARSRRGCDRPVRNKEMRLELRCAGHRARIRPGAEHDDGRPSA